MKTEALYYSKPGLFETQAYILSIEGDAGSPVIELDKSLFFPEGGGQSCDLGRIGGVELSSVRLENGHVKHNLSGPLPEGTDLGSELRLELDVARRRDNSEQHTGQHLISATLLRLFGEATKSVHVGAGLSTIDLDGPFLEGEGLLEAEAEVNKAIVEDYPVITHLCPPEDIATFPLRRLPPQGEEVIRVVEIDGLDFTPCCGTHLSSTGALRLVLLLGAEKYKGMTRLSFVAGERAVRYAARAKQDLREAARILGVGTDSLVAEARSALERLKSTEWDLKSTVRALAAAEAEAALTEAQPSGPVVLSYQDRKAELILDSAKALAGRGRVGLVASFSDLTACALAPDSSSHLGARLRPVSDSLGGKGGGSDAFFRATFPSADALNAFILAARAELSN